jgi:phosphoribosylformylglycinamidine cyclo-ligase
VFEWLQRAGNVPSDDMRRTFNMGIGLILVVSPEDTDVAMTELRAAGETSARLIGQIVPGEQRVRYA